MDTIFWYSIGMLVLALAVGLTLCTLGYRWSRHDGYEAGYNEGRADKATEVMAERHTARHAKTRLDLDAIALDLDAIAALPDPYPERRSPSDWYVPPPGPIRSHTSAAQIAPVILPEPGEYKPQAARTSEPGTATLPRYGAIGTALESLGVRPRLGLPATTGEMAAVTDDYIAQMAIDEEAYRLRLAT